MSSLIENTILGIPVGCVFALLAIGLVLNYKTSGVFNLAFAAQAYASASVYFVLRKELNWQMFPAALVAIVVVGVVTAWALDRALYRHQRTATPLAKLVTSLGLLIAVPQIVQLLVGPSMKGPPPLWPGRRADEFYLFRGTPFALDANQVATLVCTAVVVLGLGLLFTRTALGLRMRAAVESPRLLQLQGVNADRVSLGSSILSSLLASLAGVLIAPLYFQVSSLDFFALLMSAVAAAVAAGLTSIPIALAAGIGLGILQAQLADLLPSDSALSTGLRPSLPFIVLFALLVLRRSLRTGRAVNDPLSGVDPPRASVAGLDRGSSLGWSARTTGVVTAVVAAVGLVASVALLDDFWLRLFASGVCLSVVMLSIVLATGVGQTISLCQGSFAAIGAFTVAQVAAHGVNPLLGMAAGAVVAAVIAAILAIPVIRLPGIYAALATLAFAMMFESVVVPLDAVSGGGTPLRVPRPDLFGFVFDSNLSYLLLAMACVAVVGLAVIAIRSGFTGLFLAAVGGSPSGAASIGISATRHKFVVFVAGAAIAGFGGGLVAGFNRSADYGASFTFFFSLVWVAVVATLGTRRVAAAILGGVSFFVLPEVLGRLFGWPEDWVAANPDAPGWLRTLLGTVDPSWATALTFVLFGLGALAYARHPDGIISAQVRALCRLRDRGRDSSAPVADGVPSLQRVEV
jgi:branched-chain amino acid transport system permease protein